jgi:hypothetical protein
MINADIPTVLSIDEYTGGKKSKSGVTRAGRGRGDAFPTEEVIKCTVEGCGYELKAGESCWEDKIGNCWCESCKNKLFGADEGVNNE